MSQNDPHGPFGEEVKELHLWPLVDGSFILHKNAEDIRMFGLMAPGKGSRGLNTFDYDMVLERNNYIFLEPVRLRGGYGFGQFLFVHPNILTKPGVRFALEDVGELVRQIDYFLEEAISKETIRDFPDWVRDPHRLERLVLDKFFEAREELLGIVPPSRLL